MKVNGRLIDTSDPDSADAALFKKLQEEFNAEYEKKIITHPDLLSGLEVNNGVQRMKAEEAKKKDENNPLLIMSATNTDVTDRIEISKDYDQESAE